MNETYIKQCDCKEIQGQWEQKKGDRALCVMQKDNTYIVTLDGPLWKWEKKDYVWLPRQEDWQNILFSQHYAPALLKSKKHIRAAMIIMHREMVDYMEAWKIDQPCEAWCRLFMNRAHNKQWAKEGWQ